MGYAIEVILNGAVISGITSEGSITVDNTGARSSASWLVDDFAGTWIPPRNAEILIRVVNPYAEDFLADDVTGDEGSGDGTWPHHVLFGGYIRSWRIKVPGWIPIEYTGEFTGDSCIGDDEVADPVAGVYYPRRIEAQAADFSALLDSKRVDATYTSATLGDIVEDINTTVLAGLNFTTTYVSEGPTVAKLDAEDRKKTVRQVFDELQTATGYLWWIDEFRNIHFSEPGVSMSAPFQINDGESEYFESIEPEYTDELYRNVQYVEMDDGTVVERTLPSEISAYGRVENYEVAKGVTTTAGAEAFGDGLLRRYGHTLTSATIVTREHKCMPGQTIPIYLPSLGISRTMIIDSVSANIRPDHCEDGVMIPHVVYTLKVSEYGDRPEDLVEYLRRKFK